MKKSKIEKETVDCPFCNKGKIDTTKMPEFYSMTYARAFGKVKGIPKVHPERIEVHNNCPVCGKSKKEIKEVLETGKTKVLSHEERIAMLKKRGLPLVLESK
jgi:transcription elongation factor Elf1